MISIDMIKPSVDGLTVISQTMRIIIAVKTSMMVDRNHILSDRYFINDVQAIKIMFKESLIATIVD